MEPAKLNQILALNKGPLQDAYVSLNSEKEELVLKLKKMEEENKKLQEDLLKSRSAPTSTDPKETPELPAPKESDKTEKSPPISSPDPIAPLSGTRELTNIIVRNEAPIVLHFPSATSTTAQCAFLIEFSLVVQQHINDKTPFPTFLKKIGTACASDKLSSRVTRISRTFSWSISYHALVLA